MTRRRQLLRRVAGGGAVLLAGCAGGGNGGGGDDSTPSPTAAVDDTPTATPSPTRSPTDSPIPTDSATDSPTPTPGSVAAQVTLRNNFFNPVRTEVAPGSTVRWTNEATGTYSDHTVTSAQFHDNAADWSLDRRLASDESVTYTFEEPGVYEYYCTIHGKGTMCGVVLVGDVSLDKSLPCE